MSGKRWNTRGILLILLADCVFQSMVVTAEDWPQFRGPGSSGVSQSTRPLPVEVGKEAKVLWKSTLPTGHSSPAIYGDRIYLTGVDGEDLV